MEAGSLSFARRCQACQLRGNKIQAPAVQLHSTSIPWPSRTWAFDLIGPINPPSRGNIWIISASSFYTKWVGTVAPKRASGTVVVIFIRDSIICRFRIPKLILSDKGTPFFNSHVQEFCKQYGVDHVKSSPYYP